MRKSGRRCWSLRSADKIDAAAELLCPPLHVGPSRINHCRLGACSFAPRTQVPCLFKWSTRGASVADGGNTNLGAYSVAVSLSQRISTERVAQTADIAAGYHEATKLMRTSRLRVMPRALTEAGTPLYSLKGKHPPATKILPPDRLDPHVKGPYGDEI